MQYILLFYYQLSAVANCFLLSSLLQMASLIVCEWRNKNAYLVLYTLNQVKQVLHVSSIIVK